MKDKFKMELVWHNCESYPPSELENPFLLITNGEDVYGAAWHKASGYYIAYDDEDMVLDVAAWKNWWWADIEQTVRGCSEFNPEDALCANAFKNLTIVNQWEG